MTQNLLKNLSANPPEKDEDFVRSALKLMESLHREMALLVLAEWQKLGLFSPDLYQTFSSLLQPAWGVWNRTLQELRKARKKALYNADKELREKFVQLTTLNFILDQTARRIPTEEIEALKPLADFFKQPTRKATASTPLELGIRLRNRIAHDLPEDHAWWTEAAEALKSILPWLYTQEWIPAAASYPSPWFKKEQGLLFHFNGLEGKTAVRYVPSGERASLIDKEMLGEFSQALAALLGEKEKQEQNLKRLLEEMTPEEIKGVLMDDFLVGAPIGEGAFATVHKAIHLSTGARVAVKILKDASDEEMRDRFRQEAELLAGMNHHNILIVYNYGESTWRVSRNISLKQESWFQEFKNTNLKHFIAMEWVDGLTLDQIYLLQKIDKEASLEEALKHAPKLGVLLDGWKAHLNQPEGSPLPEWEKTLKEEIRILPRAKDKENQELLTIWFRETALALQYIHDQGLVHRDIKPGNLMITRNGVLKVMDFGIARNLAEGQTMMTVTGAALGTPAYMSPEQIRAHAASLEIGPASDMYSLCATFYELYTQSRCYDHDSTDQLTIQTQKLQGVLPQRPLERDKSLSWELNTLLLGGMEPEPADRIEKMQDLAADLERFQMDEAIHYSRPSIWRRMQLTYRRNTTLINTITAFVFVLITGAVLSFYNINQQKQIAKKNETAARSTLSNYYSAEGNKASQNQEWGRALIFYQNSLEQADNLQSRLGAAEAIDKFIPETAILRQYGNASDPEDTMVQFMALSPDGRLLVEATADRTARIWDLKTRTLVRTTKGKSFSFSPDGRSIAISGIDRKIRVMDIETGNILHQLKGHQNTVNGVAYHPTKRFIVSVSDDGTVRSWDMTQKRIISRVLIQAVESDQELEGELLEDDPDKFGFWQSVEGADPIYALAFHPNGEKLVFKSNKTLHIMDDWTSGSISRNIEINGRHKLLHFNQDAKYLVLDGGDGAKIIEFATGKQNFSDFTSFSFAFTPDEQMLITGYIVKSKQESSSSPDISILDVNTKKIINRLAGHTGYINQVVISPDGSVLVSASLDTTIRLWNLTPKKDKLEFEEKAKTLQLAKEHALQDSSEISILSWAKESEKKENKTKPQWEGVRIWDFLTGEQRSYFGDKSESIAVSRDDGYIAGVTGDGNVSVWNTKTHNLIMEYNAAEYPEEKSGSFIVGGYSCSYGNAIVSFPVSENILVVAHAGIHLVEIPSGVRKSIYRSKNECIKAFAVSSDGTAIAFGDTAENNEDVIKIVNTADGKTIKTFKGHPGDIDLLTFSPDKRFLASYSEDDLLMADTFIRLWDFESGEEVPGFKEDAKYAKSIAFSPDGRLFAAVISKALTTGKDKIKNIEIWEVESRKKLAIIQNLHQSISDIAFSRDSKMLISGSQALTFGENGKTLVSASLDPHLTIRSLGLESLPDLKTKLAAYSSLGQSFELDENFQIVPKKREPMAIARSNAAKAAKISWLKEKGSEQIPAIRNDLGRLLIKSVVRKDLVQAQRLIKLGANIDAVDLMGKPALCIAAEKGQLKMIKLLVSNGANVNSKDANRGTPLIQAAYNGHGTIVEWLIEKDADILLTSSSGLTALRGASFKGHSAIVKRLLQKGAIPWDIDLYGDSALTYAIGRQHTETIKLLLQYQPDINGFESNNGQGTEPFIRKKVLSLIYLGDVAKYNNNPSKSLQYYQEGERYLKKSVKDSKVTFPALLAVICGRLVQFHSGENDHQSALRYQKERVQLLKTLPALDNLPDWYLAGRLSWLSWYYLLNGQYELALDTAVEAVTLDPDSNWKDLILAHTILVGKKSTQGYRAIVKKIRTHVYSDQIGDQHWSEVALQDVNKLKAAGIKEVEGISFYLKRYSVR